MNTKDITRTELVESLRKLLVWATNGDRHGNPYTKPEVVQALSLLDRAQGGEGEWDKAKIHVTTVLS